MLTRDTSVGSVAPAAGSRLLRRLTTGLVVALVVALVALTGGAWYFSGLALAVTHTEVYPYRATLAGPTSVRLTGGPEVSRLGRHVLRWAGGYGQVGDVTSGTGSDVTRSFTAGQGTLAPDTPVQISSYAYRGTPTTALGLTHQDVDVEGPLGRYPAWYVPGDAGPRSTWVVYVHGHDATREEALRFIPSWHRLGLPVLVPTYRNDVGAPPSPDGYSHLGDTEWQDVEAAVRWAQAGGATDIVLVGVSMGGAVGLQFLARSPLATSVRAVILDSPVLDWRDTLRYQARDRHAPDLLTSLALVLIERRAGLDLDRFDWVTRNRELTRPTLLYANDGDTYVPNGPSRAVAAARPDIVTFVDDPRADHVRGWNLDPAGYEAATEQFLQRVGVVRARAAAA